MPANTDSVNVGELISKGLVLHTHEAIALIREACDRPQVGTKLVGFTRSAGDLWLTQTGELHVVLTDEATVTSDARLAAAALLDALLPPANSDRSYAVPSPLRTLAARLRESAAAVPTGDHDVRFQRLLKTYAVNEPRSVLRQLVIRASGDPDGPDLLRLSSSANAIASFNPEVETINNLQDPQWLERELDIFRRDSPDLSRDPDVFRVEARGLPINAQGRRPVRSTAWAAAAMVLFMASAYAAFNYKRSVKTASVSRPVNDTAAGQSNRTGEHREPSPPSAAIGTAGTGAVDTGRAHLPEGVQGVAIDSSARGDDRSQPVILPLADGAFSPSFGPTGRLFFHAGNSTGRLLEADLDEHDNAASLTPVLATAPGKARANDYHPRLSPDGRLIAFDSDRDGQRGVYLARPGDAQASRVSGSGFAAVPSWSPDMKWLAFVRAEAGRPGVRNVWLRDLASGKLSRQTSFRFGQIWGASWFPDGRRLCYSHEDQLMISDLRTGKTETYRTPRTGHLVRTPAVSPDGRRIVFQVFRDGVWILDLQTRAMSRILNDTTAEEFAWNPDGRRIAYHSHRDGQWRIWMTLPPS